MYTKESVYYGQKVLDMNRYNGRVNLVETPPPELRFAIFDRIAIKNRATDYRTPLNNGLEESQLSYAFFSAGNIQILQNGLRAGVYSISNGKFSVPPQNIDQLKIIMRTIYYQYAQHSNSEPIPKQIEELNRRVLEYVVPYVYNEAIAYVKYCEDQSTIAMPLELPRQNDRDYKELEFRRFF
jgi:Family of unknown function (DUF5761)